MQSRSRLHLEAADTRDSRPLAKTYHVLPARSAPSERDDRRPALAILRDGKESSSSCVVEEEGDTAMISPESHTGRLLSKTATLLNSVAEAAWTTHASSPARWELHRIGTEAYLAQRDILDLLGLPGVMPEPQADFDIAVALDEAVQAVATVPEEFQTLVTQRLLGRVSSLAERVHRSRYCRSDVDTRGPLGEVLAASVSTALPYRARCMTCRQPLTFDDGTHTHSGCEATA